MGFLLALFEQLTDNNTRRINTSPDFVNAHNLFLIVCPLLRSSRFSGFSKAKIRANSTGIKVLSLKNQLSKITFLYASFSAF